MRTKRSITLLTVLVLAGVGLRIWRCAMVEGLGNFTSTYYVEYVLAGERLLETGTLVSPLILDKTPTEPSAMMPPVYAAFVAGVYELLGVQSYAATATLRLANVLATTLAVIVAFIVGGRIGGNYGRWIAAALVAFNPAIIGFTSFIWETSFFTLAIIVSVWIAVLFGSRPVRPWEWIAFGLWLGFVALLNPALTLAYPLLIIWPVMRVHGWQGARIAKAACLSLVGWAIALAPWTVRNYVQFHRLMYVRSGFPLQLWLGVCPEADADGKDVFAGQFPLMNDETQALIASKGETAYLKHCRERARAAIAADPMRFAGLVAIRAVDFYMGTVFSHADANGDGWPTHPRRAIAMLFLMAETSVIIGFMFLKKGLHPDVKWLAALIFAYSIVYLLTTVQVRFRSPVEPIYAVIIGSLLNTFFVGAGRAERSAP